MIKLIIKLELLGILIILKNIMKNFFLKVAKK